MTATDQLRAALRDLEAKARELELEKKLEAFAEKADHYLREAAVKAGDYAHDNRDRVEGALASAGSKVDEKTDGKYHRAVEKLKTGVARRRRLGGRAARQLVDVDLGGGPPLGRRAGCRGHCGAGAMPADSPDGPPAAGPAGPDSPAGSADSDTWVDVTDTPPATQDPTDPTCGLFEGRREYLTPRPVEVIRRSVGEDHLEPREPVT